MQRNLWMSAVLLAAACGGSKKEPTTTDTTGGTGAVDGTGGTVGTAGGVVDEATAFRRGFSNPGGMWLPSQMAVASNREALIKMGVASPEKFENPLEAPLAAVVSLGGCTGSFVSADGLIVTNHHCVQGQLQNNATADNNIVENGFLAKTRADEVSGGPTSKIWVAQAITDVTGSVRDGLDAVTDPIKRKDEVEKRTKALIAACEKDRPDLRCTVGSYFRGGTYLMTESLEIRDVRLVYVPKRAVGNYGGEIDNWAWPRHTGDFSFMRAYVSPDGKSVPYDKANVPFKPKHHLKVSTKGLQPADMVMVAGYPGSTERTVTYAEVMSDVEWYLPYVIELLQARYAIAEKHLSSPGETAIKAGVTKQFAQNSLENNQGVLNGLKKGDLLERKRAVDAKIKAWAAQPGNEAARAKIERLEQLLAEERATARVDFDRGVAFRGSGLLSTALSFVRMAEERPKKDAARKPGFQDRDMPNLLAAQKGFAKRFDRTLDRAMFRMTLVRAMALPEADRPWLATIVGTKKGQAITEASIDAALEKLYAGTKLEDEKVRTELLTKGTSKALKASKDPFIKLAVALFPTLKAEEKKTDARAGEMVLVAPAYVEAMRTVLGGALAPDANSTLRVTFGTVKSFNPNATGEANWPFTTAAQILKKDTGKEPFDAPAAVLTAIKAKNYGPYASSMLGGELAVNFLSDLDITGGNSGSPTLNANGELVGLAFDGTIEGVASDVVFNGATTRTIHADARHMLWMMDAIDGADHLLVEMGITPAL